MSIKLRGVLACFVVVSIGFLYVSADTQEQRPFTVTSSANKYTPASTPSDNHTWFTPSSEVINGIEVLYFIPEQEIQGVILLFHGCTHDASDFFTLPEEHLFGEAAVSRGFAYVAISSLDRHSKCWDSTYPPSNNADVRNILDAFVPFLKQHGLQHVPAYALGASSGGTFATIIARAYRFAALAVYVSPGSPQALQAGPAMGHAVPHTAFVYMPRDKDWASDANIGQARQLIQANFPGTSVLALACHPRGLTEGILGDRLPYISPAGRTAIVDIFANSGLLDEQKHLTRDPRALDWKSVLANYPVPDVRSQVQHRLAEIDEVLNMLYASHEMTAEHRDAVLDFFATHR